jgi:hypothetical protein
MASEAISIILGGPSTVDSGAGKDRISGGDTVSASQRLEAIHDDSNFLFGLASGAATLTGGGAASGAEPAPRPKVQRNAAAIVTLDDDTIVSFVDVNAILATISLPQMTLN